MSNKKVILSLLKMAEGCTPTSCDLSEGPAPQVDRMLTWDWVKSGDGTQGALPHGPVASKCRIPEGLEDVASNPHEIVPDQVWMTSGLVALSCPLSGMCRVGVLDPGHPLHTLLHWKTYSPGDFCLCKVCIWSPLGGFKES